MGDGTTERRRVVCLGTSPTLQRTMVFSGIKAGSTNRADQVLEYASGKAANAARVLHQLGRDALYLGQVGGDRGRFFQRDLEAAGVPSELVEVPQHTRLCVTVVDRTGRLATELIEEPHEVDPAVGEELLDRLKAQLDKGDVGVVLLAGSLAPGLADDFYARALRLANEAGAQSVLDARGPSLREALPEAPTVAKPNRPELAATAGRPVENRNAMHEAMATMLEQGAQFVICTRGRDGSSVCGRRDGKLMFWEVSTPRVEVQSAVGSGDAYAAGLAAGLCEGVGLPDACRYAAACGAANAETLLAGHVDPSRVVQLADECGVRMVC